MTSSITESTILEFLREIDKCAKERASAIQKVIVFIKQSRNLEVRILKFHRPDSNVHAMSLYTKTTITICVEGQLNQQWMRFSILKELSHALLHHPDPEIRLVKSDGFFFPESDKIESEAMLLAFALMEYDIILRRDFSNDTRLFMEQLLGQNPLTNTIKEVVHNFTKDTNKGGGLLAISRVLRQ